MTTRHVHVVRIKDPANPNNFIDVKVLDALAFRGPNGKEALIDCSPNHAVPFIRDDTGHNNGKGSAATCTRVSHMKTFTSADGAFFFDAEVLDAVALRGPNGRELVLSMPVDNSETAIVDDTGSGLDKAASASTTRAAHIVKVTKDTPDNPATTVSDKGASQYVLVERLDAMTFNGPNGLENLLFAPGASGDEDANEVDSTQYGANGAPPDNADPNVYIAWGASGGGGGGSQGPWLGASNPVSQGLLWWINNASGGGDTLLLLIQVSTSAINLPLAVTISGLPFLPGPGTNLTIAPGDSLKFSDGASGSNTIPITQMPSAAMVSHLYMWTTPYQFDQIIPPVEGSGGEPNFSHVSYVVVNLTAVLRDFPLTGASGASGPTWDKKITVKIPDLPASTHRTDDVDRFIVWYTASNIEPPDPFHPFGSFTPTPPWFVIYSNDTLLPSVSKEDIYQIIQNPVLGIPFGLPPSLPLHLFGNASTASALAAFLTTKVTFPVFVTEWDIPGGTFGQSATHSLEAGVFKNVYLNGASGIPALALPGPGVNPPPDFPFTDNFLIGNEFWQWYLNGASGVLPTLRQDPYAAGAQGVPGKAPDPPPGIGATGATGASGASGGGTGIGPISVVSIPFEFSIGSALPGVNATITLSDDNKLISISRT